MAASSDVARQIRADLPLEQAPLLDRFVERMFSRELRDRKLRIAEDRLLALTRSAFEFFFVRSQPIAIRVIPGPADGLVVVETTMADCPFIIDSLLEYFRSRSAPVRLILHPVFNTARDSEGRLVSIESASAAEQPESLVHAELEINPSPEEMDRIQAEVRGVLRDVRDATRDFDRMTARALQVCEETAAQRDLIEVRDFLRWLVQGGFVFLGYRRYAISGSDGAGKFSPEFGSELGILREREDVQTRSYGSLDDIPAARRKLFFDGPPLVISKSRIESIVHRRRPMDLIAIRRIGGADKVQAFDYFVGLFTSKAYSEEAQHIPILRAKLGEVIATEVAVPGSHDYKALVAEFNSFPKDELFRASVPDLLEQLSLVLDIENESRVRLKTITDSQRGNVIALVVMPREVFSAEVRLKIQHALAEGLKGTLVYFYLALDEGYLARLHFCFSADPPKANQLRDLETTVTGIVRRWEGRFQEHLGQHFGARQAHELAKRWTNAFGPDYQASTNAQRAVSDVEAIEGLVQAGRDFRVEIVTPDSEAHFDELRMLGVGDAPGLSQLMPILHNFGISVLSEDFHVFRPQLDGKPRYVQAFSVRPLRKLPGMSFLGEAITAVRNGLAEDDALNAIVLTAGLKWREIALLRAYLAAAFQMRLVPARPTIRRTLITYPELARAMFALFAAKFDPDREASDDELAGLRTAYLEKAGAIENIVDDRIARMLLSLVEATVRTNYFCAIPSPDPYIALKFDSGKIANLPDTPPLYEIHVNSPRMEGCHLRAARVARGGIRFSDRPDDYRTEILDLMKTQTVKNAIIVPMGAKGGFISRQSSSEGPPGIEAYKTLICAMLDLTDNATDAGVEHPPRVKVLDNDGPYLVVAADKGTATFSDVANTIALERSFWLGDAFASGGEHGFDHKQMGITARGAWESARRHLREMGRDPDRGAPVTMVGIGDMSGDVFGNGLLRSRNLKLIAAFDHRHIFIDPDPDPATSFDERKRLYEKPRSQWSDYNPALISSGGGVWRRGQKRIELSAQARVALGCADEALDGESLIAAILRAPVDLLYNGGIGTYVRAAGETDEHVGDRANDACRITATELRARVVVEGGNLGLTQRARIEYALAGGRINTDAIDNSAGVDTSDHEVNLKILLQREVAYGEIGVDQRNQILGSLAEEVAGDVLRDNRDQALLLSLEQVRSHTHLAAFRDHLQSVQERGILLRYDRAIPPEETLRERHGRFAGLTRPELALVTAYTKIDLVGQLDGAELLRDSFLVDRYLRPYFPRAISERFGESIAAHRLRSELIATGMVNELVDLMGSTFVFGMMRDHAALASQVVRAWVIASEILGSRGEAERFKNNNEVIEVNGEAELEALFALERACSHATEWALRGIQPDQAIADVTDRFKSAFAKLASEFEDFLTAGERANFEAAYRGLRSAVVDGESAHRLARLEFAGHLLNVLNLSLARKVDTHEVAAIYFGLASTFDFSRLELTLASVREDDRWERRAAQELADELRSARIALCKAALDEKAELSIAIQRLKERRAVEFDDAARLLAQIASMPTVTMPAVHVAIRALTRLAASN